MENELRHYIFEGVHEVDPDDINIEYMLEIL
jgi:hypothetical protein